MSNVVGTPQIMILHKAGGLLHFEFPNSQWTCDSKLDGSPAPLTGPSAPRNAMLVVKFNAGKLSWVETVHGRPVQYVDATSNADGKTLTEILWGPEQPDQKLKLLFDKQ